MRDMTEGIKELRIISQNVTSTEIFVAHIIITVILITLAIVAYDWWMKRHPR